MKRAIKNAAICFEDGIKRANIIFENGKISEITERALPEGEDFCGDTLAPGFIDIHTHGCAGVDFNLACAEELPPALALYAKSGVTSLYATVLTDSEESLHRALRELSRAKNALHCGQLAGIHLEGPFLAPEFAGAMPPQFLKTPDIALFERFQHSAEGEIKLLTIAPELAGAENFIAALSPKVAISLGHSAATFAQTEAAFAAGARGATHTGNAMRLIHQHEPAILGAALTLDGYCECICDGLHLAPAFVRLLLKCKGIERLIGVSDSLSATGLPDGEYSEGANRIYVTNGDAKLENGVRAGSTLTADRWLRNFIAFTGSTLTDALKPITKNVAALHPALADRGEIAVGKRADFVRLSPELMVKSTYLLGEKIFEK